MMDFLMLRICGPIAKGFVVGLVPALILGSSIVVSIGAVLVWRIIV